MAANRNDIIKYNPKAIMFIIAFVVLGFLSLILIGKHQASNFVVADYKTEIPPTIVTGEFNVGRGGIGYKKNHFIMTSAIMIENKLKYVGWKANGPIIDFNSEPHVYTLDDLAIPYVVSKNANSDTLFVDKDGYPLKFLMVRQ